MPLVAKNLDPDQARHFVGPDLGPNCLQRLSVLTSRQSLLYYIVQSDCYFTANQSQ